MSKSISFEWFKHLPENEQNDFKALVGQSPVTRRIQEIILEKEDSLEKQETTLKDYDTPSWSHKQADRNGYRRCLKELKDLFSFIER